MYSFCISFSSGSARVEGDEDEEDIDDIEHEFNYNQQSKQIHMVDAMLHGKMSYGRGHEDDENAHFPSISIRSRQVITPTMKDFSLEYTCVYIAIHMTLLNMRFPVSEILNGTWIKELAHYPRT